MKTSRYLTALCTVCATLALSSTASADSAGLPRDTPPIYRAECGSCHAAFPPQLLDAKAWRQVMATLDKHYGDNASLDAKTTAALTDYLVRHAGSNEKVGSGGTAPRLTETAWFRREHREVPERIWRGEGAKLAATRAANCGACHRQAEAGSYREREILLPDGRRWEGD